MKDSKDNKNNKTTTKVKSTNRIKAKKIEKALDKKEVVKEEVVVKEKDVVNSEKSRKNKASTTFNLIEVIIIMIITAVFGILIGSFVTYFKDNVIEDDVPEEFDEFLDVYNELSENYFGEVEDEDLIEAGIKGMVEYLGDPYSSYLDYEASYSLNEELEGEFYGMGVTVTLNESGQIYIAEVMENSPAVKAGFEVGDIIKKVGDEDATELGITETSYLIKGEENTKVDITIERNGEEKVITLTRGKVELTSVYYEVLENTNIGYISITVFAKNTPEQFEKAMDDLISKNVDSVIIDVRCNSGGYLTSAEAMAKLFLKEDAVIYQLEDDGKVDFVKNSSEKKYDIDVAILIDGGSASASELFAGALRDNLGVKLVGTKSYGKGTVQATRTLSSGAMIKYTIQEWFTPNGNLVNGVGLTPEYVVELDENYYLNPIKANDLQLQKAIEILKK